MKFVCENIRVLHKNLHTLKYKKILEITFKILRQKDLTKQDDYHICLSENNTYSVHFSVIIFEIPDSIGVRREASVRHRIVTTPTMMG